jgi:hypothetical protein
MIGMVEKSPTVRGLHRIIHVQDWPPPRPGSIPERVRIGYFLPAGNIKRTSARR